MAHNQGTLPLEYRTGVGAGGRACHLSHSLNCPFAAVEEIILELLDDLEH